MTPPDPHDLTRFISAQAPVFEAALAELRAGRKRSHWMWFIFPQIAGLGSSPTSRRYAIPSADAARAYLAHPVLGPRQPTRCSASGWRPAPARSSPTRGVPSRRSSARRMT